ncbi:hypothetical protein CC2G_015169 [Coprinopsis cinerea AmutBmut pab1-1]|nr:hypothetical protein CC2G_015169 [Coprinopsis cinerea AmutBmut pab1-1]
MPLSGKESFVSLKIVCAEASNIHLVKAIQFVDSFTHYRRSGIVSTPAISSVVSFKILFADPVKLGPRLHSGSPPPATFRDTLFTGSSSRFAPLCSPRPKLCDFVDWAFHDPSGTGTKRKLNGPRIYAAPDVDPRRAISSIPFFLLVRRQGRLSSPHVLPRWMKWLFGM